MDGGHGGSTTVAPRPRERARGPRRPPGGDHTTEFPTLPLLREATWPDRTRARILIALSVLVTSAYIGWWLIPGHTGSPAMFVLLAVAETFTVVHLTGLWHAIWSARVKLPPPGSTDFAVDVFVPTCGEPLEVLRRTITAAVGMDQPHETYVLDDAVRGEVRALARELGARYIPREDSRGAKAGNLNHALALTEGDLVAVFDADHVARPDFLTHLLGYFEDPRVAIVQTPQFYGNARDNEVAERAWLQQVPFYGPILRGKQGLGAAFLCGTNALLRRAALEEVGGFSEDSVVEDMMTSMRLHRKGWESVYFPYVLAEGDGPTSLRAYFSQQLRWARGSLGALIGAEPLKLGYQRSQRIQYMLATSYYLIGLAIAIYLTIPIVALLLGLTPFGPRGDTFLFFYAPHLVLALHLIRREQGRLGLRHLQFTFGTFPVYTKAALAAFVGRDTGFQATGATQSGRPPRIAYITVAAFAATAAAMVAAPLLRPLDAWAASSYFWAAVNCALLWGVTRRTLREELAARREGSSGGGAPAASQPAPANESSATDGPVTRILHHHDKPPLPEEALSVDVDLAPGSVSLREPRAAQPVLTADPASPPPRGTP